MLSKYVYLTFIYLGDDYSWINCVENLQFLIHYVKVTSGLFRPHDQEEDLLVNKSNSWESA